MVVTIPYTPRSAFVAFHRRKQRWAVIVAHRRAGKTVSCINDLIKRAITFERNDGRFAYIAPFLKQAKDVAWDYLKRFAAPIPNCKINESELTVTLPNGSRIRLYGADNGEALRGIYLDGCVIDEPADMDDEFWSSVLRPALSDRKGWCVWIGTPKGRNGFYRLYDDARLNPDWFVMVLKASESGIIDSYELQAALQSMGKTVYQREYECDFSAAIDGSIYGDQIQQARLENRIKPFHVDPRYALHTFWDLGQSDFTAIWVMQFIGRDICVIDYLCRNGEAPGFYATAVKDFERKYGARVGCNYLPHDANNIGPSGQSYVTYLRDAELPGEIKVVPRTPDVWLGIHELRSLLPRAYIHSENCAINWRKGEKVYPSGLDVLEYYHSKEMTEGGTICERPVHDIYSHGCFHPDTLVDTPNGQIKIKDINIGDSVSIGDGYGLVMNHGITKFVDELMEIELENGVVILCTEEHSFFTNDGIVQANRLDLLSQLVCNNSSCIIHLMKLKTGLRAAFSDFIAGKGIGCGKSGISTLTNQKENRHCFTKSIGKTILEAFQKVRSSIALGADVTSQWLNCAISSIKQGARSLCDTFRMRRSTRSQIKNTSGHLQQISGGRGSSFIASCGNTISERFLKAITCIMSMGMRVITGSKTFVSYLLQRIHVCTLKRILGSDLKRINSSLSKQELNLLRVVKVSRRKISTPVYDITVEGHHCYSVYGVLVSNCDAIRTMAEAHRLGLIAGNSMIAVEAKRSNPVGVQRQAVKAGFDSTFSGSRRAIVIGAR